jgi:predicted transcriptional regulator
MGLHNMTLQLSDATYNILNDIAKKLGDSKKEAIKKAIALLELVLEEQDEGSKIEIINDDKKIRQRLLPIR